MSDIATLPVTDEFSAEQKEYLSGFSARFGVTRNLRSLPTLAGAQGAQSAAAPAAVDSQCE